MERIRSIVLITLAFALAVIPLSLLSQTPATPKPTFEVTSVKPGAPGAGFRGGGPRGNSFNMTNMPLRQLVQIAYQRGTASGPGIQLQLIGAPSWMDSELYDVQAKADCSNGPIPREQMQLMVQSMLEERFQLKVHYETRELPIYNLVVAKEGLKMKPSEDQTSPLPIQAAATLCGPQPVGAQLPALPPRGAPFDPNRPGAMPAMPRGAMMVMMNPTTGMTLNATAAPIGNLIGMLQNQAGRPIIDKTNLKGLFDIKLNFSMEGLPGPAGLGGLGPPPGAAFGGPGPGVPGGPGPAPSAAEPVPSLFTAIQEQLGLRLESTKGPVDVLVIDSVQKPTEN